MSAVDVTTNRCGVRITGKNAKVMAIQVTNLTLECSLAKKFIMDLSTIRNTSDDRVEGIIQSQLEMFFAKRVMEDIPLCKEDGVKTVLSYLGKGSALKTFLHTVVNKGLISVVFGFLKQCEHGDFSDMVDKVQGDQRTPADWIMILSHLSTVEQCKLEIACGIEAIVRCLCDDTKRLFFKSNKYWHEAVPPFLSLLSNLLRPSSGDVSSNVSTEAAAVYDILLQSKGSFESIVQKHFWSSHRPDLLKEYESYHFSVGIKKLETLAHDVIRIVICIGKKRHVNKNDGELIPSISQDLMNLTKKIVKTPVVSRAYDPECNVYFVVGMVRMLKNVNSDDSVNRKCYFETLDLVFTTLMLTADCIDNDVIVEVIDLGRNFTTNIDDAESILKLSLSTIAWRTQGKSYPIDKCIAFAIKSGLLDMCFEFLSRFACDPTIQLRACDPIRHDRDDLMVLLVSIAAFIQAVDLHQKTAKAIRDARSQIIKMLTPLMTQERNEKSFMFQFVDILSSILDLNEGSCSCCNTPIVWRTALFCGGCRRVAYCGLKCQKSDWRYGSHSSECSFLARSADVLGLTTFNVRRRRNISTLTGLRNNIVTSQYKLFLRHEDKLSTQLLTYQDRIDYIARFNLSLFLRPISFVHYHDHFTCPRQRKWFEDFRSLDRVLCMFTSDVFNGELDKDEYINMISLYAAFPIPNIIQSGFKLYATATMKDLHNSTKFNSNELYLTVGNMYKSLSKEERIYWDKQAALELVDSSSSIPPHTRAEALKATGNGYFKTGDYKSAVEMYKSAATINSSDPTHWSNLAASYEKLGMYDEMMTAMKEKQKIMIGDWISI